jgi:quinolinate synthase
VRGAHRAARAKLGKDVVLLVHHYQRPDVYCYADLTGDSLKLSRLAAQARQQVHRVLRRPLHGRSRRHPVEAAPDVILPDLAAGCSMADMANLVKVERAGASCRTVLDPDQKVTPVTYINSAADLKAFCGEHGGIVCTSSNAKADPRMVVLAPREGAVLSPTSTLGRWTGYKMGIPLEQMVVWDFDQEMGGLTREQIENAKMILWKGHCSVHQMFQPQHIARWRAEHPEGFVISHPEAASKCARRATTSARPR